jgi:hypothetical protein
LARASLVWKPVVLGLGFSWISLDSLVRIQIYQWVTTDLRWKIFSGRFFPQVGSRDGGRDWFWRSEAQEISSDKHRPGSDFHQGIVV